MSASVSIASSPSQHRADRMMPRDEADMQFFTDNNAYVQQYGSNVPYSSQDFRDELTRLRRRKRRRIVLFILFLLVVAAVAAYFIFKFIR